MRRVFVVLLSPALPASLVLWGGCSSGHAGNALDAGSDSYGIHLGDGGTGGDGNGDDGGPTAKASVRIANMSPDLGPVDYCWRETGASSYQGPVLGGGVTPVTDASPGGDSGGGDASLPGEGGAGEAGGDDAAAAGDAGNKPDATVDASTEGGANLDATSDAPWEAAGGDGGPANAIVFGARGPTLLLPTSGTFDVAIVRAGQTSCAGPLFSGQVTLDAGKSATVVLMGLAAADAGPKQLAMVAFTDATSDAQSAQVRIIHAALGTASAAGAPSLAVHAGATVVTSRVDPGQASDASQVPPIDALGYTTLSGISDPSALSLTAVGDAAATTWTAAPTNLGARAGTAHTGLVVSLDDSTLGVVWCDDSPSATAATACALLPAPR